MQSWEDESLLRRPPQEDSRRHRARYATNSSGPSVRRKLIVGQALLEDRKTRKVARAQKELWTTPQDRRKSPTPPHKGRRGAPRRHHLSKTPLFGTHNRYDP